MSAPVKNNKSTNNIMYIAEYTYNDLIYTIQATMEEHNKLSTDQNFLKTYIKENTQTSKTATAAVDNTQSDLIMESNASNTCTSEDSNFKWSHKMTQLLLQSYRERALKFRDPKVKKKTLWAEIVGIFQQHGHEISKDMLDTKMRNLKKTHRKIKDNKSATGRERISWEYYDTFEDIFSNDRTINFGPTLSSRTPLHSNNPSTSADVDANSDLDSTQHTYSPTFTFTHSSRSSFSAITDFTDNINLDDLSNSNGSLQLRCATSASEASSDCALPSAAFPMPSTSSTTDVERNKKIQPKAVRAKAMYSLRKKQLEIDNRRIEVINTLTGKIDESNNIQSERNKLLEMLIRQRTNNDTPSNLYHVQREY